MAQYRYSHTFAEQLSVQVGAFGSLQRSFSSLYPGITLLTFNVAQFAQMEWARSGWKLAAGVRNESNLNPGCSTKRQVRLAVWPQPAVDPHHQREAVVRRVAALCLPC